MGILIGWLIGTFLSTSAPQTPPDVPREAPPLLTLADAVEQALVENDRLVDMGDSLEQAELSVRLARNAFRPKVVPNILGSFGQSDVSNQTYRLDVSQRLTFGTELRASVGATTQTNQLGNYYTNDTTLQLTQPILRGFGRTVARRQLTSAEVRRRDTQRQKGLSEQQVSVEIASAYFLLVAQTRLVQVGESSVDRAHKLLEASEAKLQAGRVSQLDVFRARQLVTQAESQLLDARAAVEDGEDQLRYLMGAEEGVRFAIDQRIPREIEPFSPSEAAALALSQRPELTSAQETAEDAERAVSFAKNQLLPQLDLSVAVTRREASESLADSFGLDDFEVVTFLTVSMPSDRTQATIQHHSALIERDRKRRSIRILRTRIADEARRTARAQKRLLQSLEMADTAVEFARKELELAELRFQRGLSNNLDVVNAEANVLTAQSRQIAILAQLAVARISLRATLGILDPRKDFGRNLATS